MIKKLTISAAAAITLLGAAAFTAPAQAGPSSPVRAGKDSCGNFNVWVNGEQVIYYLYCGGPDWD